jgi:hypothetical protein
MDVELERRSFGSAEGHSRIRARVRDQPSILQAYQPNDLREADDRSLIFDRGIVLVLVVVPERKSRPN